MALTPIVPSLETALPKRKKEFPSQGRTKEPIIGKWDNYIMYNSLTPGWDLTRFKKSKYVWAGFHGKTFTLGSKSYGTAWLTLIYVSFIHKNLEFKLFLEDYKETVTPEKGGVV